MDAIDMNLKPIMQFASQRAIGPWLRIAVVGLVLATALLGAGSVLGDEDSPRTNSVSTSNQVITVSGREVRLPTVAYPPAQQPPVGLATDTHLNKTPPRETRGLDLVKLGWTYNCMECHKLFPAKWHYDRPMNEHKDIKLDHGNNRFCLNCHHPKNRNAFVDYDGSEIAEADVVLLCAKCHGTTHRDWKAGVHGRQNGYWNTNLGEKTKLRCIQCHDPHSPKFQSMKPLPPLTYPPRAAGGSDRVGGNASPPHGEGDARLAPTKSADSQTNQTGDGGVAATQETK